MRLKASCFNPSLAKNLLRRFWPLFALYAILLLLIPVSLAANRDMEHYRFLCGVVEVLVYASAVAAPFIALAAFGFLYQSRSCGMLMSLPLKRSGLFCTVYFTLLLPFLCMDALLLLLLLLFDGANLSPCAAAYLLSVLWLGKLAFYGFAVFCAQLTGSAVVLPMVYYLLLFAAAIAEGCTALCMENLIYGYLHNTLYLRALCPVILLYQNLNVTLGRGLGTLAAYAGTGVLFSCAAFLLFQRRRAETAGDAIAVQCLKPVFRACMTFGCAVVFAGLLMLSVFTEYKGTAAAIATTLLLLTGAVLGWFAAEMLIRRTVRVFGAKKRGLLLCLALVLAFALCCEFDVCGTETRVPRPEDISSATLYADNGNVTGTPDAGTVSAITDAHLLLSRSKALCESTGYSDEGPGCYYVRVSYLLKDGTTLERAYTMPADYAAGKEALLTALNTDAAVHARVPDLNGITPDQIEWFEVSRYTENYNLLWCDGLSCEDFLTFYRSAVLADREAGTLGSFSFDSGEGYSPAGVLNLRYCADGVEYDVYLEIPSTALNSAAALRNFSVDAVA